MTQEIVSPVGQPDFYDVQMNVTLNVEASGVLDNDEPVKGRDGRGRSDLIAELISQPVQGSLIFSPDGAFAYTPVPDYIGPDSFVYSASDGVASTGEVVVSLTIADGNLATPVAVDDNYSLSANDVLIVAAPGVLENDRKVTGKESSNRAALVPEILSSVSHGSLALSDDGSFMFTPEADFAGLDSFTYAVYDGVTISSPATVTLTVTSVNTAPVAAGDSYDTEQNTTLNIAAPGVLGNDTDADGDPLTAALQTGPANGTLTLNADGGFSYTPTVGFSGSDSFTYVAQDGALDSSPVTVMLTVTSVNAAPVAAGDSYATEQDTTLDISAPGVLGNDTDADGDPLTAALQSGPANGTLTLAADGGFSYTPTAGFSGTDSFSYVAQDGAADSSPATVTLTVNSVNTAPVATGESYLIEQDQVLTVPAPGVLGNDTDADGDPLTAALQSSPVNGTLTLAADGGFSYTPTAGFSGTDSFSYVAQDGTADSSPARVTLTVTSVNTAPVAAGDSYAIEQDQVLTVPAPGVLGNDTDADGDPLTAALQSGPANGTLILAADGGFSYTPAAGFSGTDSFAYVAQDGALDSSPVTVTVTVASVNTAPVAAGDSYATEQDQVLTVAVPGVLDNDTDPDGDPLTAGLISSPANGTLTLSPDGGFSYTPTAGFSGSDSFTYVAQDGALDSSPATVTLTVTSVNTAPVAAGDSYATEQEATLNIAAPGVLGNDTDAEGDPLTAALQSAPANGTLTLIPDGSFSYTPTVGFSGSDSFTYVATDGAFDSSPATVTLTVTSVNAPNDPPVISGVPGHLILQGDVYEFLPNASDPNGDTLTFFGWHLPTWASLDPVSGALTGTPQASDVGVYKNISIGVTDGEFSVVLAPFEINVAEATGTSVALSWEPPTTNTDGSFLADFAGYKIYYWNGDFDPSTENLSVIDVPGAGMSAYTLDLPVAGYWKIVITAYNALAEESRFSNVIPVLAQ